MYALRYVEKAHLMTEHTTPPEKTPLEGDPQDLVRLANWRMPFGKYKGTVLVDLPEPYVVWFFNKGLPTGKLGELMETLYVIKANGLEPLLDPFRT